jgi:O6-methylguanine-DNA--protein-cysteine methyltransferase
MSHEPQAPIPGAEVPEIAADYEDLKHRRKVAHTFTHGAAVANNYAFTKVFDELHEIDPGLTKDYGKVMAYSELGYFSQSPEYMRQVAQAAGEETQGGMSQLRQGEDGSVVIYAAGITFPMLYHEIVKGCMGFLSGTDKEDDTETAAHVRRHSDFIDDEQTMMHVGPELYRQFMAALGPGNEDLMPYVYDELQRLPSSEYNKVLQGLTSGTPGGTAWFQQLARKIRQEQSEDQGAQGESLVDRLLGH